MFKWQIAIDCPNHCHLSDPSHFLFLSAFNVCDAGNPFLLPLEGIGL
jgi:hypothetical protein